MTDLLETISNLESGPTVSGASFPGKHSREFLEALPLPAFIAECDNTILDINSAGCKFLGYSHAALIGKKIVDIVRFEGTETLAAIFERLSGKQPGSSDCELLLIDKRAIPGEVFVRRLGAGRWLVLVNDISSRKRAEATFLESEELRWKTRWGGILERLSGGIAHDFNNILAVISLHTDILNLQIPADSPIRHRVNEIKAVSNDAVGIVNQLLAFAGKQALNPRPSNVNSIVHKTIEAVRSAVSDKLNIELSLDPHLGECFIDENRLADTLMYLAINANDAMPGEGLLKIETENVILDRATSHKSQSVGPYVQLSVSDNGVGMNSKTIEQIFEPFFSTKGSDKPAGLGLATVYGFIKQSGGFIWVESELGHGATFTLQFPRVDQPSFNTPTPSVNKKSVYVNETVLLVDDEQSVRSVVAEILRLAGFKVFEAGSGKEAIEIAESIREPIHLILTDFTMPKMDGRATALRVRELHPDVRTLFMSGNFIDQERVTEDEMFKILRKPFSSSTLLQTVREILGEKPFSRHV